MKIGILGGGQLARMLALSAHQLGIRTVCIDPNQTCSAKNITKVINVGFFDNYQIEKEFSDIDYLTYETENLPIDAVNILSQKYNIHPNIEALKIFQDRLYEKQFLNSLNIPTTKYHDVNSWEDVQKAIRDLRYPFLIKTRKSGYDGKGQAVVNNEHEAKAAWQDFSRKPSIIEKYINFDFEISIISVRNPKGEILFYPIILNQHKNGVLFISQAPYINDELELIARKYALSILQKLDYVGVMTIEFFCQNNSLIANEIAPRVHNSGHWTIEGADTSQFENHLRAIADLPLGSAKPKSFSAMINLIGKKQNIRELLAIRGAHYHWYNKEPLDGRKLGHLTLCASNLDEIKINTQKAINLIKA